MTDTLLPLIIAIPLVGGGCALIGKAMKAPRISHVLSAIAVSTLAGSGVVLAFLAPGVFNGEEIVYALGGWPEPYGISLILDGFAWISSVLAVGVSLLVGIAALSRRRYDSSFFFFFLLLTAGMLSVALTGDLFTMFVSFEIVAIAAYVLIAYDKTAAGLMASLKYLILSSVGILFFLFGVFLVYRELGVLSLSIISRTIHGDSSIGDARVIHLAIASLCVGIGVRTAFIPFHTWLPEAHAYAPHPISALLSGVLIKVSLFSLFRLITNFSAGYLSGFLMWIGGLTAFIAVVLALSQTDAKRLLAYHSVSQMGYVLAAFASVRDISMAASLSHAINHALFKALLFLTVGTAIQMAGKRDIYSIKPVGRKAPVLALLFLVGALSIAGIPPFNGFASKAYVLQATRGSPVEILLWITGAATVASFIKLSRIFLPARSAGSPIEAERAAASRPGVLAIVSMVILAALCVITGLFSVPVSEVIHRLAGPGTTIAMEPIYTGKKLLSTAASVGIGIAIYFGMTSPGGKHVTSRIKGYAPTTRSVLLLFLFGLLGFSIAAYV